MGVVGRHYVIEKSGRFSTAMCVVLLYLLMATGTAGASTERGVWIDVQFKNSSVEHAMRQGNGMSAAQAVSQVAVNIEAQHDLVLLTEYRKVFFGATFFDPSGDRLKDLLDDPRVHWAEEAGYGYHHTIQYSPPWGLDRIDQRSRPLNGIYNAPGDGAGVKVYVVDSGIRSDHADFGGRVGQGFSAIDDGNGTGDVNGHGTQVASIIGGTYAGVAKLVSLVPVRVTGYSNSALSTHVLQGLDWVAGDVSGYSVVNLSLGGFSGTLIDVALQNLAAMGVHVVASAGNDHDDACKYSPSRLGVSWSPAVHVVGSINSQDNRSGFSNWGPCVLFFAPGEGITAAHHTSSTSFVEASGTSFAAPHVAGTIAAQLNNLPPSWHNQIRYFLSNSGTRSAMNDAGHDEDANKILYTDITDTSIQTGGCCALPNTPEDLQLQCSALYPGLFALSWSQSGQFVGAIEIHSVSSSGATSLEQYLSYDKRQSHVHSSSGVGFRMRSCNYHGCSPFSEQVNIFNLSKCTGPQ